MLLSIVLWEQEVWGWSALQAGLAIAPGPLMVPLMSFVVAGRLIARYGPALVIALGSAAFAAGVAWWAVAVGLQPDYVSDVLGGMILTGIGVGLTLPTMMATASSSLPPTVLRHRLRRRQHDPPDRAGPRRGRPGGRARHRRRPRARPSSTPSAAAGGSSPPSRSSASFPPSPSSAGRRGGRAGAGRYEPPLVVPTAESRQACSPGTPAGTPSATDPSDDAVLVATD